MIAGRNLDVAIAGFRRLADYRISIVPRLWRLRQSKNHRLFQDKTVNPILSLPPYNHPAFLNRNHNTRLITTINASIRGYPHFHPSSGMCWKFMP